MTASNEKLKHIISDYDPKKRDILCKIDVVKLSQMQELRCPSPDRKDVYETFFEYASALIQNHPTSHLNEYIDKMFGESLNKMAEIAPEAAKKYEELINPKKAADKQYFLYDGNRNLLGA